MCNKEKYERESEEEHIPITNVLKKVKFKARKFKAIKPKYIKI